MFKIRNKVKFDQSENRMKKQGDVQSSIFDIENNKNLFSLLKERFEWMNKFINFDDKGIEVGSTAGFSKDLLNVGISKYLTFQTMII